MPPDKARLVDPEADLSWNPGWGGRMHTVYFGDNFDDVSNAEGGSPQLEAAYELDTLGLGTTYYWRVDVNSPGLLRIRAMSGALRPETPALEA